MKLFWAAIFGILEVLIFGPLDAMLDFFGWRTSLSRNVVDEIHQDQRDAQWKREFLAQKQLERSSYNPFLNFSETKTMQWGRSSQNRKSKR